MREREVEVGQQFRKRGWLNHVWTVVSISEMGNEPRHAVLVREDDRTETKTISCLTLADARYYERI